MSDLRNTVAAKNVSVYTNYKPLADTLRLVQIMNIHVLVQGFKELKKELKA